MKMKTKTASTLLFLAAAIVGGVSCQRATRDGGVRIPLVGISHMGPSTVSTSNAESTTTTTTTAEDEEELVKALEFEEHVTGKKELYRCDIRTRSPLVFRIQSINIVYCITVLDTY